MIAFMHSKHSIDNLNFYKLENEANIYIADVELGDIGGGVSFLGLLLLIF